MTEREFLSESAAVFNAIAKLLGELHVAGNAVAADMVVVGISEHNGRNYGNALSLAPEPRRSELIAASGYH